VYLTNFHSVTVSVIDTATNNVTSTVDVGSAPRGVAVNPDGTKVYVANLYTGAVFVIDTATNTVTDVGVGNGPYGVAVSPDGTKVYVANEGSNNVSVIDTATNKVTATVNVGNGPVAFGQSIGIKQILIGENPVLLVAAFSACPVSGKAPLKVKFTDKSTGSPTSWHWNFGDNCTSTAQNPVHKYCRGGGYTVSLKVKNAPGCDIVKKNRYVIVKN
jgi:YVTN family beta-propeller protein